MSSVRYFDIHGHVNFADYDDDREEVINRAQQEGVGMIVVGTDIESSRKAVELAESHENVWAAIGIHPTEAGSGDRISAGGDPISGRVVAIGECGLDYLRSKPTDIELQKTMFIEHIELANRLKKPLMLHIRNGKTNNAYQEAVEILKGHAKVPANFHFFAGKTGDLASIIDIGGSVSFTGVITFTNDYDELVRYAPLDRIMSETDCPFVAPAPHRGRRNEPAYVIETIKAIARIRRDDEEKIRARLFRNAVDFFGLDIKDSDQHAEQ